MLTRIHVNQHNIRRNKVDGVDLPVISVKSGGKTTTADGVAIVDNAGNEVARIVYAPEHPLSCGARVWIETTLGWRPVELGRPNQRR